MDSIKSIFVTVPQWLPLNPSFSPVPFVSYLKCKGFDSKIIDLNIEYYLYALDKSNLNKSLNKAFDQLPKLFNYLSKNVKNGLTPEKYNDIFKSKLLKYNKIKEFKTQKTNQIQNAIDTIDYSIEVMRSKELFYNPSELTKAMANIDFCLEIASLLYFPALVSMSNYSDPFLKLNFKDILSQVKKENLFSDFYREKIQKILDCKPDLIGISINSTTQVISALTLAYMLKKKKNIKISIGGNFFSRLADSFSSYPEFFKYFCDFVMLEEGEIPNFRLCQYLHGDIPIEGVPNLIYCKKNKVHANEICSPLEMQKQVVSDLSDYDFSKYFIPEIVLPQQSSKGCYWGKCTFCDHSFGQQLSIKSVDKFVKEIEIINAKYGIKYFEFIDECISPFYLKEFSKKILENKLDICWFNNARLEENFDKDTLIYTHKAGLKMLLWGFESASKKIMKLINKGIDLDSRINILKNAREAGIWNFAFIFFGFPSETKEDAQETIDFIKNNKDVISSYGRSIFTLGKHSMLQQNPEQFGITKIYKDMEDFSTIYHFESSDGMNEKEVLEVADKCLNECSEAYNKPLWMYLFYREILFLYICKYGADKVENMKI